MVLPLVQISTVEALARAGPPAKPAAKAGTEEVLVFWKKTVLPSKLPMKALRSLSPSMSAKTGAAKEPTSLIPKGLIDEAAVMSAESSFSRVVSAPCVLLKSAIGKKRS